MVGRIACRADRTDPCATPSSAALLAEGERYMNALGNALAQEQVRFLEKQVDA